MVLLFLFGAIAQPALAGVVDISSSDDAQVVEGYPDNNYGSNNSMYVASANSSSSYGNERAWVKFNLEGRLPDGAAVTGAKLRLYCWGPDDDDDLEAAVHSSDDDSWNEDNVTWNNQSAYSSTALDVVTLKAGEKYRWYEWDVTGFVQTETDSGDTVLSFVVKAEAEGQNPWRTFVFDGKEYSSALAPRLRIEYDGGVWSTDGAFTIYHMNDVHSRILPHEFDVPEENDYPVMEMVGGASYFTAKMLELKEADLSNSLILDAGDISEGNPLGDLRSNGGMVDVYNLLDAKLKELGGRGIDAVVVGNHDVRAQEMLDNLLAADFPVISANVWNTANDEPLFPEYVTVTVNGTKVGILGYTNDESSYVGADVENVSVKTCVWEDEDSSTIDIKEKVAYLRDTENCDVVILLAHMGHSRLSCGDDAVVADTGDVDPPEIVVAGHWHTWDELVWQPAQLNGKTIFTEAASYMQYVGELTVSGEGKYISADKHVVRNSEITPNAAMETLINTLTAEYNSASPEYAIDQVIGYSAVDLSMDKDKWWTVSEYPWNATNAAGAWVCDAMVWKAGQIGHSVDLAMQSGGSIRRDVARGPITYLEIYETYPWTDNDTMTVTMTGQEIWDALEDEYCGASLSDGWEVHAEDSVISAIYYNGTEIGLTTSYTVAMSSYMAEHETWASGKTTTSLGYGIRDAIIEYTAQYTEANPMYNGGISTRYFLDTELAGGFRAVVTMVADSESQPYYEAAFIRLIEATDETLARRNGYGLSDLVNSDGSINTEHQFSETMLYRSHLGFRDGWLKPGDIIEVWGEGGSYSGNPQFVDQHGIWGADQEMNVLGHDETLAQPQTVGTVSEFWDEDHENHYVRFYAEKTGDDQLTDAEGTTISVFKPGGYYSASLPGSVGDILEVTGVNTMRFEERRFRLHTANVAGDAGIAGYPAYSSVDAITSYKQTDAAITLTATAVDPVAGGSGVVSVTATEDSQVVEGNASSNYGSSKNLYIQSSSTSSYLDERVWVKFDLEGQVPSGAALTSATLSLYQWHTYGQGADMNASAHGSSNNDWDEDSITWNTQPGFESAAESTVTLEEGEKKWYSWDVAGFVQDEVDAGDRILSFVLKPETEGSSTTATYCFDAKEYSSSYAPKLEVQYEVSGAVSTDPTGVDFYYRYSENGITWGDWTVIGGGTQGAENWRILFSYPNGYGYYEFYSVATDVAGNVESAPVMADASVRYVDGSNDAPEEATDPGIADGQTDVGENVTLTVTVADSDADLVTVEFWAVTESGDELIGTVTGVATGQSASVQWMGLSDESEYRWYVVVDDGEAATGNESNPWTFYTTGYIGGEDPTAVPSLGYIGIFLLAASMLFFGAVSLKKRKE
jgi:2',3'-cyclic-nucleotide 2'-phosphodiesterase (5'-nucleotidase family)